MTRGPHLISRTRPISSSIPSKVSIKSWGVNQVSTSTTWLRKLSCSTPPQGACLNLRRGLENREPIFF